MTLRLRLSRKGTHRAENRDFSGWAHNAGAQLYVIADGTSKPGSGQLAKAMIQHVLGAFGGMGSLNDLLILGANGQTVRHEEESAVNKRLDGLRGAIRDDATALRYGLREPS